eukprot:CAMPEP_0115832358 /NCGR_PEP_ID=MMETSP0287-20121206/2614_1 /TAXON_ID=412157 /ORGANISM="Chrysochromulina rotalis, Strain UIO044" /LENGTH=55 /DNA_ID=CAMNT_0003285735 /DNA_START=20 /DNA_END=187 /DNA_ORIENTATION=-
MSKRVKAQKAHDSPASSLMAQIDGQMGLRVASMRTISVGFPPTPPASPAAYNPGR